MAQGMPAKLRDFAVLVVASVRAWHRGRAGRLAAALAYYGLLSMAPTVYIIVYIVGQLYGTEPAVEALRSQLEPVFGPHVGTLLDSIVRYVQPSGRTTQSTLLGAAVLLWGGSGFFIHLQDALNTMWDVPPVAGRGPLRIILNRLVSFLVVVMIGGLFFVAIVVNTVLTAWANQLAPLFPFSVLAMRIVQFTGFFLVFILLMAITYKVVPDAKIAWGDVWVGAAVTAVLLLVGQVALAVYLSRTRFTTIYGMAGLLIVILVWLYYSAQIFFLGAQFTREYANRFGSRIQPSYAARGGARDRTATP